MLHGNGVNLKLAKAIVGNGYTMQKDSLVSGDLGRKPFVVAVVAVVIVVAV